MMYRLYRDDQAYLHAVKRGFSWPAFLVPEIWLYLRGLPFDACVVIALLFGAAAAFPPELLGLVVLTLRVTIGFVANRRIEATFRSKGWRRLEDVHARSVVEALNTARSRGADQTHGGLTSA